MRVFLFVAVCLASVCASNLQYRVDLKQLPAVTNMIIGSVSKALRNKTVVAVKRDVDSHISLTSSTIKYLDIHSLPTTKVSYKNHMFYLTVPNVEVGVNIEFMDNKD